MVFIKFIKKKSVMEYKKIHIKLNKYDTYFYYGLSILALFYYSNLLYIFFKVKKQLSLY